VKKPIPYRDLATRQFKRKSEVTKNELPRERIGTCIRNELKFRFVLTDSWFSATENLNFIAGKAEISSAAPKDDRLIAVTGEDAFFGSSELLLKHLPGTQRRDQDNAQDHYWPWLSSLMTLVAGQAGGRCIWCVDG